ncbi:MAG TPA: hypothetical protein DEO40_02045 [Treponema sp.]|nr:hypothetical protein [Treponema sp.]HCA19442.1 hypothetical protein [Treponema sp.]
MEKSTRNTMKKELSPKKKTRTIGPSFLFRLTGRASLFLVLMNIAAFLLYVFGNFQHFLDSSQQFILQLCLLNVIVLAMLCVAGLVLSVIVFLVRLKARYWFFFLCYLLCLAVCIVLFVFLYSVVFLSAGLKL